MDNNTNNIQPPTPPSNGPADIFSGSGESTNKYEAIDLHSINDILNKYAEYFTDTRSELEAGGVSATFLNTVGDQIKTAQMSLRDFEIQHAENALPHTDEFGVVSEVILRQEDPKAFDVIVSHFDKASQLIDEYFEKHRSIAAANQK